MCVCSIDGTPQCCSCNKLKPVGEEWVGLQDGRLLCLDCLDTLVVDTKDAQPLYDEVRYDWGVFWGVITPCGGVGWLTCAS